MQFIEPVIVRAGHQHGLVENLVRHCESLDGTKLRVIPAQSKDVYPHCNNAEFALAARTMKGQPFFWMEPDSIPIKPGWLKELTREYYSLGKPFLLSSDTHPPHDLVGGIGVYGPETSWLIPASFPRDDHPTGWDGWMIRHLAPLIAKTSKIQHSYGIYDERGIATPHRFLFDRSLIRHNAVIFHRDKYQDLTRPNVPQKRFYHTGDLGDIIAALPIIRALGGGELVIGNHEPMRQGWRPMQGPRYEAIRPLLEAQPYLSSVRFEHGAKDVSVDLSTFRSSYRRDRSLTASQAEFIKMPEPCDLAPWLEAEPAMISSSKIVVARTERYHNEFFPWRRIALRNFERLLFVGTDEEYFSFSHMIGARVPFTKTDNLLALARVIKGSELFIGNQSCPCWIAMAMGHNLVQETHPQIQDSIIPRDNAVFCVNGDLSALGRLGISI